MNESTTNEVAPKMNRALAEEITAFVADLAPYAIELHLRTDSSLPKKYGRAIKGAGGKYSEARGMSATRRFVELPSEARDLIDTLVREYGFLESARRNDTMTMIARFKAGARVPSNVSVVYIMKCVDNPMATFEAKVATRIVTARANGNDYGVFTNTEVVVREHAELLARSKEHETRTLFKILQAGTPSSMDEFHALTEALTQYIENTETEEAEVDNNVTLARLKAAHELLDRANAAYVQNLVHSDEAIGTDQRRFPFLDAWTKGPHS